VNVTKTIIAMVVCAATGVVGALNLSLSLKKDTFLPYEPVYARLDVSNGGTTTIELPQVSNSSIDYVFDFSVVAPTDKRLKLRLRMADPSWCSITLPPKAAVHAVTDLTQYASRPDSEPKGTFCFQPGVYSASAQRGDAVSNSVAFTVREPTAVERSALVLYRSLVYYRDVVYWNRPGGPRLDTPAERVRDMLWRREDLARKIIQRYPQTAYALLAERNLAWDYHSRVNGSYVWLYRSSPQAGAWRDSARTIYARALSTYPDSPIAEYMLCYDRLPEVFGDSVYTRALLQGLSGAHPGTLVGREAARQLGLLTKQTSEQK
jgi:hypothetical protein